MTNGTIISIKIAKWSQPMREDITFIMSSLIGSDCHLILQSVAPFHIVASCPLMLYHGHRATSHVDLGEGCINFPHYRIDPQGNFHQEDIAPKEQRLHLEFLPEKT